MKLNRRLEEIKMRFISGADPKVLDIMQRRPASLLIPASLTVRSGWNAALRNLP